MAARSLAAFSGQTDSNVAREVLASSLVEFITHRLFFVLPYGWYNAHKKNCQNTN